MRHSEDGQDPDPRVPQPAEPGLPYYWHLSELQAVAAERSRLDEREGAAIDKAREHGLTWAQIATALGMHHRQGAQQRYRRLRKNPDPAGRVIDQSSLPGTVEEEDCTRTPELAAKRAADAARWARSELV